MNENSLLKMSLIFSVLGILIILFISENSSVSLYDISEITMEKIDEKVRIGGEITNIVETGGLIIVNVKDSTEKITVILFEDKIPLRKYQKVEVVGTVTEYKEQIEIIADEIILL